MTKTAFLIPYKGTNKAKTRLRRKLNGEIVDKLLFRLFGVVIQELSEMKIEKSIYILTKNANLHLNDNCTKIIDKKDDFNEAIVEAVKDLSEENIIIIMADLYKIRKKEIWRIIKLRKKYSVVIAPSENDGTSILAFSKKLLSEIEFCFGNNSSLIFEKQFKQKGINYFKLRYKNVFKDIDNLEDILSIKKLAKELNLFNKD